MQEVFGLGEEHLFSESSVSAGEYMSFRIISYESRLIACYSSNVIYHLFGWYSIGNGRKGKFIY